MMRGIISQCLFRTNTPFAHYVRKLSNAAIVAGRGPVNRLWSSRKSSKSTKLPRRADKPPTKLLLSNRKSKRPVLDQSVSGMGPSNSLLYNKRRRRSRLPRLGIVPSKELLYRMRDSMDARVENCEPKTSLKILQQKYKTAMTYQELSAGPRIQEWYPQY